MLISSHIHTRTTNTCITGDGLVEWEGTADQHAEEKRWVFSSDLKEKREDECLTERGREFQITGLMYWKDFFPRRPPAHSRNAEYLSIQGCVKGKYLTLALLLSFTFSALPLLNLLPSGSTNGGLAESLHEEGTLTLERMYQTSSPGRVFQQYGDVGQDRWDRMCVCVCVHVCVCVCVCVCVPVEEFPPWSHLSVVLRHGP